MMLDGKTLVTRSGPPILPLFPHVLGWAMDSIGQAVWTSEGRQVAWADVMESEWINGYPPVVVGTSAASVEPRCDCGAAVADPVSTRRTGGPGHADWCDVHGKA